MVTAVGAVWDELPSEPAKRRWGVRSLSRLITEASAAFGTLVLSLAVFSINGMVAWRGSEIVARQPDKVLLFRDPGAYGTEPILWLVVPAALFNAASQNYGDVVTTAYAEVAPRKGRAGARFPLEALMEPVFAIDRAVSRDQCEYNVRCIPLFRALMIERPAGMLTVAGGAARNDQLGFKLDQGYCLGRAAQCDPFQRFTGARDVLQRLPQLRFRVVLQFHDEGDIRLECTIDEAAHGGRAAIIAYMERTGWANLNCRRS